MLDLLDSLRTDMTLFFSTHLLDDVAHLADRIAVLGGGEIRAEGPIDSFVTGDHDVSWRIRLDAPDPAAVLHRLEAEDWVGEARWSADDGGLIRTTDRERAEAEMLRALRAAGAVVTELRPTRRSLEDIYLELVDDGTDEGKDDERPRDRRRRRGGRRGGRR
jgi:ABC-2 type transport system ATP-binding protein